MRQDITPADSLNGLLQEVVDGLLSRTILWEKQYPVLYIDEANRLKTLLRDESEHP